ncbi:MAG TPA: acetyl-CoA carboxylase, biotin carboxyl carrier protein [Rhodocyclaceae bacterium]|nr:acetyl-CoA carboxylase, biotin carboxyl carrier protein [Rhodocyclaceae bacterium]
MGNENMTYQDLLQIVELIKSSSHFSEFRLKTGDIEVDIRRAAGPAERAAPPAQSQVPGAPPAPAAPQPAAAPHPQRARHVGGGEIVPELGEVRSEEAGRHAAPASYPEGAVLIRSPMVGSFYRAPEPGARPFVEVGQRVEADTTVCIVEVMKLMNSIPAGTDGVVTHILLEDGEPVEFGQTIMVIEPR